MIGNYKKNFFNDVMKLENNYEFNKCDLSEELIKKCLDKAYIVMTPRTIKGHGRLSNEQKNENKYILIECFLNYFKSTFPTNESEFDSIHRKMCERFLNTLNKNLKGNTLDEQKYGKAQKIVNVTFKYLYCALNSKYDCYFKYCHMLLDSYTLRWVFENCNINNVSNTIYWSNLTVEEYEEIQKKVREKFKNKCVVYKKEDSNIVNLPNSPFLGEFIIWSEEMIKVNRKNILKKEFKELKKQNIGEEIKNLYNCFCNKNKDVDIATSFNNCGFGNYKSDILILGTISSKDGKRKGYYYTSKYNQTYSILDEIFKDKIFKVKMSDIINNGGEFITDLEDELKNLSISFCDVIDTCIRISSTDNDIIDYIPIEKKELNEIIQKRSVKKVFYNSDDVFKILKKIYKGCKSIDNIREKMKVGKLEKIASPSPRYNKMTFGEKVNDWKNKGIK